MRRIAIAFGLALLGGTAGAQVPGADDNTSCLMAVGPPESAAYYACRVYLLQSRSDDPYVAAMGRAGVAQLEQRALDRAIRQKEAPPDFSAYGVPAPQQSAPRPNFGCVTFGDGLGGGITDCD